MESFTTWWLVAAAVLLVAFAGWGVRIAGRPLGILVDSRNKMSLSRFQVVLWTWLLVSAVFAVVIARRTTDVVLDPELWALLGISVASATGSTLIKGTKARQDLDQGKLSPAAATSLRSMHRQGILHEKDDVKEASLADLVKGEEVTDYPYVDISKAQMLLFTLAIALGYAFRLATWEVPPLGTEPIELPAVSTSMATLLGISHAGYLATKAAPKTPVA